MLCSCPKLTPLQSRFLASILTLGFLGVIYWTLSHPHVAYAAELAVDGNGNIRGGQDHNWHRIGGDGNSLDESELERVGRVIEDEATSVLSARAPAVSTTGGNNVANIDNIQAGDTTVWMFTKQQLRSRHAETGPGLPGDGEVSVDDTLEHVELRKREVDGDEDAALEARQVGRTRTMYISINTCLQPDYVGSGTQSAAPPQLTLYVASDASNRSPGPDGRQTGQTVIPLDEGYAALTVSVPTSDDWYMSVHAPELSNDFKGVWNYELAVSIDNYFHSLNANTNLSPLDTDSTAVLLVTDDLTQGNASSPLFQQWIDLPVPYIVFARNTNDTRTLGLSNSFCGLNKNSPIVGKQSQADGDSTNVQMQMTTRGIGNKPKEQFYVTSLNRSSTYYATLAQVGNSTSSGNGVVGGGGKVWKTVQFRTKSDGNCALLFNLDFCSEVAYAVPSNPDIVADYTRFQSLYDNHTLNFYHNFNYSLQQIPCHTTSKAQYSLAKDCSDCAKAYKDWLCAVSIPRCEDFSNDADFLQMRNMGQKFYNGSSLDPSLLSTGYKPMSSAPTIEGTVAFSQTYLSSVATNSSRNPMIDMEISPGPYKEVLPCQDLCYSLVQSCPAALGFGCPFPGKGLETSYGRSMPNENGMLTCSYLGARAYVGAGDRNLASVWVSVAVAAVVGMLSAL